MLHFYFYKLLRVIAIVGISFYCTFVISILSIILKLCHNTIVMIQGNSLREEGIEEGIREIPQSMELYHIMTIIKKK